MPCLSGRKQDAERPKIDLFNRRDNRWFAISGGSFRDQYARAREAQAHANVLNGLAIESNGVCPRHQIARKAQQTRRVERVEWLIAVEFSLAPKRANPRGGVKIQKLRQSRGLGASKWG